MEKVITITNIIKLTNGFYQVFFSANYELTELKYQTSTNGTTWSDAVDIEGVQSPKILEINNSDNFYIRLSDTFEEVVGRIHTNAFTNVFN
jgi:hypothetical protein